MTTWTRQERAGGDWASQSTPPGARKLRPAALVGSAPVLGSPVLNTTQILVPTSLTLTAPAALGTGVLGQAHVLATTTLATSAAAMGGPVLANWRPIPDALSLSAGTPALGTPGGLTQVHALRVEDADWDDPRNMLATGRVVLGSPALRQNLDTLVPALGLTTGAPVLGRPVFQSFPPVVIPAGLTLTAGTPVLGTPALTEVAAPAVPTRILNFAADSYSSDGGGTTFNDPASLTGWAYTRAGSATAPNADGSLTTFGANEPRITNRGLLSEPASTNLLLNSATLSTQTVTVSNLATYKLSFYGTGSITYSGAASGTLAGTGATNRVSVLINTSSTSLTLTVTGSVTNAQLEQGTATSSYIATVGAAATRPIDVINPSWAFPPNATAWSMVLDLDLDDPVGSTVYFFYSRDASFNEFYLTRLNTGAVRLNVFVGSLATTSIASADLDARALKLAVTYNAGVAKLFVDGVEAASSVSRTLPGAMTIIRYGSQNGGTNCRGFIKRMDFYEVAMTAAEAIAATTP